MKRKLLPTAVFYAALITAFFTGDNYMKPGPCVPGGSFMVLFFGIPLVFLLALKNVNLYHKHFNRGYLARFAIHCAVATAAVFFIFLV